MNFVEDLVTFFKRLFGISVASGNTRTLRDYSSGHFAIGVALSIDHLRLDATYREVAAREFSAVTTENSLKMEVVAPERNRYDFSEAEEIVAFANQNRQQVRGHTLVWHLQLPTWVSEGTWTEAEAKELLEHHIATEVGHFRGRVTWWDVVNEALADDGKLRDTFWLKHLGEEYLALAFRAAHRADPAAKLFYNDYQNEASGPKATAQYELLKRLKNEGVPVHGVGLQMHLALDEPYDELAIRDNIRRLRALGLEVHITELDIRLREPVTDKDRALQAERYRQVFALALREKCEAAVLWGVTDAYSWIPLYFKGYGEALLFDKNYQPKEAYRGVTRLLSKERV